MISGGKNIPEIKNELCSNSRSQTACEQTVDANAAALQNDQLEEAVKQICFRDVNQTVKENTSQCVVDLFVNKNVVAQAFSKTMTGVSGGTRLFDVTALFAPESPVGKTLAQAIDKAVAPAAPAVPFTPPVKENEAFLTVFGMVNLIAQPEMTRAQGICSNAKDNLMIKTQCDAMLSSYLKQLHDEYKNHPDVERDTTGKVINNKVMSKNLSFPNDDTLPDGTTKYPVFKIKGSQGNPVDIHKFIEVIREMESLIGINTCNYSSPVAKKNCEEFNKLPKAKILRADEENPNAPALDKVRAVNKKVREAAVGEGSPQLEEEFFANPAKGINVTTPSAGGTSGMAGATTETLTLDGVKEGILKDVYGEYFLRAGFTYLTGNAGLGFEPRDAKEFQGFEEVRDSFSLGGAVEFGKLLTATPNSEWSAGIALKARKGRAEGEDVNREDKVGNLVSSGPFVEYTYWLNKSFGIFGGLEADVLLTTSSVLIGGGKREGDGLFGDIRTVLTPQGGIKFHLGDFTFLLGAGLPLTSIFGLAFPGNSGDRTVDPNYPKNAPIDLATQGGGQTVEVTAMVEVLRF